MLSITSKQNYKQGRREAINIGGCRHVLTNFSEDFDQVVKNFPGNVVDGGGGQIIRTNLVKKNFPD